MSIPHKRKTIEGRRSRRRHQPSTYAVKRARWRIMQHDRVRKGVDNG